MKVVKQNIAKQEETKQEIRSNLNARRNQGGFKRPAIALTAAVALVAAPIAGLALTNVLTNAAEVEPQQIENVNVEASFIEPSADVTEQTTDISKKVVIDAEDGANVTAGNNATIADGILSFSDNSKDAKFSVTADDEHVIESVMADGNKLEANDGAYTLDSDTDYFEITVNVNDKPEPVELEDVKVESKATAGATDAVSTTQKSETSQNAQKSTKSTSSKKSASTAKKNATKKANKKATASKKSTTKKSNSAKKTSSSSASVSSAKMTSEELAMAKDIFNSYNSWRKSHGLSTMKWDSTCANMAYNGAKGCSQKGSLVHRLGIPAKYQTKYSDILQYSTYKMSGSEAINNWSHSSGHLAQLRCKGTGKAAVGVYKNSQGVYYFAIVYTFSGTNVG